MARAWLVASVVVVCLAGAWARPRPPAAETLLATSDAAYDFPVAHGVVGLTATVRLEQNGKDIAPPGARIHYIYTGPETHGFSIENLAPEHAARRDGILAALAPLDEYLMPRPGRETFAGAALSVRRVARQMRDTEETSFFQVVATRKTDGVPTQETRIVLDARGLVRAVEERVDGQVVALGSVEHEPSGPRWRVTRVSTRFQADGDTRYHELRIRYTEVNGVPFPARIDVTTTNKYGRPLPTFPSFTAIFEEHRVAMSADPRPAPPNAV